MNNITAWTGLTLMLTLCALILLETSALYKLFTYLLTYLNVILRKSEERSEWIVVIWRASRSEED